MDTETLAKIRQGAELANYEPYIRADLDAMQKAIVHSVMVLLGDDKFPPEIAQAKWMEYVTIERLKQRIGKKITVGKDLGKKMPQELGV